ncbi:hypothetical protein [Martelella sp. AMO21009]
MSFSDWWKFTFGGNQAYALVLSFRHMAELKCQLAPLDRFLCAPRPGEALSFFGWLAQPLLDGAGN